MDTNMLIEIPQKRNQGALKELVPRGFYSTKQRFFIIFKTSTFSHNQNNFVNIRLKFGTYNAIWGMNVLPSPTFEIYALYMNQTFFNQQFLIVAEDNHNTSLELVLLEITPQYGSNLFERRNNYTQRKNWYFLYEIILHQSESLVISSLIRLS